MGDKKKKTKGDQGSSVNEGPFTKHANAAESWGKFLGAVVGLIIAGISLHTYFGQVEREQNLNLTTATLSVFEKLSNDDDTDDIEGAFLMRVFNNDGIAYILFNYSKARNTEVAEMMINSLIDIGQSNNEMGKVINDWEAETKRAIKRELQNDDPYAIIAIMRSYIRGTMQIKQSLQDENPGFNFSGLKKNYNDILKGLLKTMKDELKEKFEDCSSINECNILVGLIDYNMSLFGSPQPDEENLNLNEENEPDTPGR